MQINLVEYLTATVSRFPDKPAIKDRDQVITFHELDKRARVLAAQIAGRGDEIRRPFAIFLPKSADQMIAVVAILQSGNFYVPLDVNSPIPRISAILKNLHPAGIITNRQGASKLGEGGVSPDLLLLVEGSALPGPGGDFDGSDRLKQLIDTDPAYVIYTSGSTGVPKGVVVTHRGVIDYIDWATGCFGLDGSCAIGNQSPFYFDNSTLDIYLCLATGATLVLIPEEMFIFPARLVQYLKEQRVGFIFWVPSLMANVAGLKLLDNIALPDLRYVLFAGEVMSNKHLNYWRAKVPQALFANLYGPTEITVDCTYFIVDREFGDNDPLPIGVPCRNSDILILNDDNRPAQGKEQGELCVRGSSLASGYWNDPERSDKVFVRNPLNPNYPELIYRTGDLVYRNERGEIMFVGRKDFQIKHLGYRIELGEIETAVLGLVGINHACVLYDQVKKEIALFYEAGVETNPASIRRELAKSLPKYMLPTAFHRLDLLPRNPNGKIDRKRLAAEFLTPEA